MGVEGGDGFEDQPGGSKKPFERPDGHTGGPSAAPWNLPGLLQWIVFALVLKQRAIFPPCPLTWICFLFLSVETHVGVTILR